MEINLIKIIKSAPYGRQNEFIPNGFSPVIEIASAYQTRSIRWLITMHRRMVTADSDSLVDYKRSKLINS